MTTSFGFGMTSVQYFMGSSWLVGSRVRRITSFPLRWGFPGAHDLGRWWDRCRKCRYNMWRRRWDPLTCLTFSSGIRCGLHFRIATSQPSKDERGRYKMPRRIPLCSPVGIATGPGRLNPNQGFIMWTIYTLLDLTVGLTWLRLHCFWGVWERVRYLAFQFVPDRNGAYLVVYGVTWPHVWLFDEKLGPLGHQKRKRK